MYGRACVTRARNSRILIVLAMRVRQFAHMQCTIAACVAQCFRQTRWRAVRLHTHTHRANFRSIWHGCGAAHALPRNMTCNAAHMRTVSVLPSKMACCCGVYAPRSMNTTHRRPQAPLRRTSTLLRCGCKCSARIGEMVRRCADVASMRMSA
jgi:hypothetical protein